MCVNLSYKNSSMSYYAINVKKGREGRHDIVHYQYCDVDSWRYIWSDIVMFSRQFSNKNF